MDNTATIVTSALLVGFGLSFVGALSTKNAHDEEKCDTHLGIIDSILSNDDASLKTKLKGISPKELKDIRKCLDNKLKNYNNSSKTKILKRLDFYVDSVNSENVETKKKKVSKVLDSVMRTYTPLEYTPNFIIKKLMRDLDKEYKDVGVYLAILNVIDNHRGRRLNRGAIKPDNIFVLYNKLGLNKYSSLDNIEKGLHRILKDINNNQEQPTINKYNVDVNNNSGKLNNHTSDIIMADELLTYIWERTGWKVVHGFRNGRNMGRVSMFKNK